MARYSRIFCSEIASIVAFTPEVAPVGVNTVVTVGLVPVGGMAVGLVLRGAPVPVGFAGDWVGFGWPEDID